MWKTDKGLQRHLNHPGGIPLGLPEKPREVAQLTRKDELESSGQHGFCPLRQSDWQEGRMFLIRACCCSQPWLSQSNLFYYLYSGLSHTTLKHEIPFQPCTIIRISSANNNGFNLGKYFYVRGHCDGI